MGIGIALIGVVMFVGTATSTGPPYGRERSGGLIWALIVIALGLIVGARAFFGGARPVEERRQRQESAERGQRRVVLALKVVIGVALVVAGVLVELGSLLPALGSLTAWALVISGLAILVYRQVEAPILTGIALVLVAPLLGFMAVFIPVIYSLVAFFLTVAVALYGVFLIVGGLARRSGPDLAPRPP